MKYFDKLKSCFKCPLSIFFLGIEIMFLIFAYANIITVKDFCITLCGYLLFNLIWTVLVIRIEQVNDVKLF